MALPAMETEAEIVTQEATPQALEPQVRSPELAELDLHVCGNSSELFLVSREKADG